ncbi:complement C2 [Xyrauchen texanus]|uniref:complement C2 n=1 Tax=Xyrauchen texanus TaxID=154827 RepID=UPI002242BC99|nr:complement C2 [Xyrauchen texanus]
MHYSTACFITFSLFVSICKVQSDNYDYDYEESVPKACPMSESIIGGTVEYSNGGAKGSLLIYHCSDGFEPYPISQKTCNTNGEWQPKVSKVKCEETNDYGDYEETQKNCSMAESIKGGTVSYSNQGLEGSILTYHCDVGHYPYPTAQRVCDKDGQWSGMRLPNGKRTLNAMCKEVLCPAQLELDNGQILPWRQWFKVGEQQTFSCHDGFVLSGSSQRNCTQWGGWTGTTPVCDDQSEDCKNPGSPPGALRSGERFRIGAKVQYQCQLGLDMLGSSERHCLDSREWSGVEPRCYAQYTFDQPAIIAQALGGSLSAVMDVSLPKFKKSEISLGRSIKVTEGRLNIFILLDTSGSISTDSFQKSKNAIIKLVHKLDSYEVNMKFDIISYASEPKDIVSISDINSEHVDYVVEKLKEFSHLSHGKKIGTNLYKALERVYDRLAFLREHKRSHFNETQNVIIIATDGHSNMGRDPKEILAKIRHLLGYKLTSIDHTQEDLLDVYVFAVGQNVNKKELQSIASFKKDERHIFALKDYDQLGFVFNQMISDSAVTKCGVAQEEQNITSDAYTRPWHVDISWFIKKCRGSILTENWVLTAAHCFIEVNSDESISFAKEDEINILHGNGEVKAMEIILHPQFNVKGLKDKNVKEFYDYDIALVRVSEKIKISSKARPICLPCTKSSNRALRKDSDATCDQHKKLLIHQNETPAQFIRQGTHRTDTLIHSGTERDKCIHHGRSSFPATSTASLTDVITDRFMCTGGSETRRFQMTCKGDSGGSLFLRKRMRYFQVAVISWGTKELCDSKTDVKDEWPLDARDFHISVFPLMSWLKQHLHKELQFLPL